MGRLARYAANLALPTHRGTISSERISLFGYCYSASFLVAPNRAIVTELSQYSVKNGAKWGKMREEENRSKLRLAKGLY